VEAVEAVEVVALASVDLVEAASVEAVPAEAGKKKEAYLQYTSSP